ncbi:dephospho-CoA kinase [Alkalihalophilus marmarensis]|jgi:dephospho-CoA kinase|uniref:Dephospho-CoA kinase n=1 Tax=Alkalihalophilus marmarensis DSM 21297 TaxID=1188261 RepID=U6SLN9_9BACI|nr:dephospho-CoA kinase [Alkalihalophilus marmarensis]ERN52508.1 dephospho-CoA kinase [Alkalihalophilus marmarensis DSM 21297]MCM3487799.1 dephospho-CoA kinase [Alkalihalophilus marmarensis]
MLIGLTGGIASGKSTVSNWLSEHGYPIIDADKIARDVVEPGRGAYEEIVGQFGRDILFEDGTINRKKLGSIIFKDEKKRSELNQIVHPAVRREMLAQKDRYEAEGHETIIFDIPLLFESNLFHLVDRVMLVYVDKQTQLNRLLERDQAGSEDAKARIASQLPLEDKKSRADYIVDNSGSLEETFQQLQNVIQHWSKEPF